MPFIPFLLFASSAFFSRALLSVSVGLMAIAVVYWIIKARFRARPRAPWGYSYLALVAWFLLVALDGFRAENSDAWVKELLLKLPLLIAPVYIYNLPKNDCRYENVWLFFVSIISGVALVSGVNYALHYEEINALLLQSKHIPIFGNIHHIYFGIYQALGLWVCLYFLNRGEKKRFWQVNLLALLVMIHILASRTGLLAFYASIGVYLVAQVAKSGRIKPLIIGGCLLLLVPVLGYQFSESFRNKVLNSAEDFTAVKSGKDINYKSLAMRVEAWRTGTAVFKKHMFLGVGSTGIDKAMQRQYVENKTTLYQENRIGPHNQFLEMSMAHGIVASVLLILVFCFGYRESLNSPVFLGMLTVFFISFLLESYLERQQGIIAFCLFLYGFYPRTSVNGQETTN